MDICFAALFYRILASNAFFSLKKMTRYLRATPTYFLESKILRQLCYQKGVEIIEAELCPDHIHMLVSIPPKYSVASFVGYLKGKSSLMIFDRHANLKYKYGNRHFWCRGYYVDTVGRNKKAIEEYIRNQLQEDIANDQISMKEYIDPFTGGKKK